jgi:hypothetical protein
MHRIPADLFRTFLLLGLASACGGGSPPPAAAEPAPASTPAPTPTSGDERRPSLTPVQIRAVIGERAGDIQRCYNDALVRNPSHRGSVLVFFEIAPDGQVLRSNVLENTSGDSQAATCLLAIVARLTFPPTGHGIMETRYSFDFREVDRDGDGID